MVNVGVLGDRFPFQLAGTNDGMLGGNAGACWEGIDWIGRSLSPELRGVGAAGRAGFWWYGTSWGGR
jgi:hypothetical protein